MSIFLEIMISDNLSVTNSTCCETRKEPEAYSYVYTHRYNEFKNSLNNSLSSILSLFFTVSLVQCIPVTLLYPSAILLGFPFPVRSCER